MIRSSYLKVKKTETAVETFTINAPSTFPPLLSE